MWVIPAWGDLINVLVVALFKITIAGEIAASLKLLAMTI